MFSIVFLSFDSHVAAKQPGFGDPVLQLLGRAVLWEHKDMQHRVVCARNPPLPLVLWEVFVVLVL